MNDYKKFDLIIQYSKSILTIYKKLCILEINGKKNTKLYKKNKELLKWLEIEESKLYSELNLNYTKITEFIEFLNIDILGNTAIDKVMIGNYIDIHKYRVYNNLRKYANEFDLLINKEYAKKYNLDTTEYNQLKRNLELTIAFTNDLNNLFLKNLQEQIKKRSNNEYKKELITAKYMLTFMENKSEFISYNVLQSFSLFTLLNRIYSINQEEKNDIINELEYDKLIEKIKTMLTITDDEYDSGVKLENIFLECYMNAYIQMITFDEVFYMSMDIEEIINKLQITNNKKMIKKLNKIINKSLKY